MLFAIATLARSADDTDLSSATTATRTGPAAWVGEGDTAQLSIPFDRDLTTVEVAAVIALLTSPTNAEADLRAAASAFLKIPTPTTAQLASAVKTLVRLHLARIDREG